MLRAFLALLCGVLSAITVGLMAGSAYCFRAANPPSYDTGYQPGLAPYEARELWLGVNDILAGRSTTLDVDWTAFNPWRDGS